MRKKQWKKLEGKTITNITFDESAICDDDPNVYITFSDGTRFKIEADLDESGEGISEKAFPTVLRGKWLKSC